jgi:hypothetical protein
LGGGSYKTESIYVRKKMRIIVTTPSGGEPDAKTESDQVATVDREDNVAASTGKWGAAEVLSEE